MRDGWRGHREAHEERLLLPLLRACACVYVCVCVCVPVRQARAEASGDRFCRVFPSGSLVLFSRDPREQLSLAQANRWLQSRNSGCCCCLSLSLPSFASSLRPLFFEERGKEGEGAELVSFGLRVSLPLLLLLLLPPPPPLGSSCCVGGACLALERTGGERARERERRRSRVGISSSRRRRWQQRQQHGHCSVPDIKKKERTRHSELSRPSVSLRASILSLLLLPSNPSSLLHLLPSSLALPLWLLLLIFSSHSCPALRLDLPLACVPGCPFPLSLSLLLSQSQPDSLFPAAHVAHCGGPGGPAASDMPHPVPFPSQALSLVYRRRS